MPRLADAPRRRSLGASAANLLLAATAVAAVCGSFELAFRVDPRLLPAGIYGAGRRSEVLGFNVHGSRVLYTKVRPAVVRDPNSEGFLDSEHQVVKPPGAVRVGFFGDSYVEAAQVPLETVFFRQLEDRLRGRRVETLGFGVSGWGGVQALRAFQVFGPRYGLDAAVYVFVENDPGDESYELAAAQGLGSAMPYAELAPDGASYRLRFTVDAGSEPWWFRPAKWLQSHSLLAHLVRDRVVVLRQAGVQVRASAGDRDMTTRARGVPNQNDLPASWPAPVLERTQRLGELVLADWKRTSELTGARLAVLYVPRGEPQLRGEVPDGDTWRPWLERACARLAIPLWDPSAALRERLEAGEPVYGDHFTPAGHEVIAGLLADRVGALIGSPAPAEARTGLR